MWLLLFFLVVVSGVKSLSLDIVVSAVTFLLLRLLLIIVIAFVVVVFVLFFVLLLLFLFLLLHYAASFCRFLRNGSCSSDSRGNRSRASNVEVGWLEVTMHGSSANRDSRSVVVVVNVGIVKM